MWRMAGYLFKGLYSIQQILVEEFPTFSNLRHFVAIPDRSSSVYKSRIVPMKLLFRDEKYTNENIQILQQFSRECNLTGSPQVRGEL